VAPACRGWLAIKPRTPWKVGGETYDTDTVIGMPFSAFLAGERGFTRLFKPADRRALQEFFWCGGRLVLSILDDLRPVFEVMTPSDGEWSREVLTGLPDLGTAHVWPLDVHPEESNGDLLAAAQDQLTPPSLYLIEPRAAPQLLKRGPEAFDPTGLVGTRHEAVASDGTRIPYCRWDRPARQATRRSISMATAASEYRCRPTTTQPSENSGSNVAAPA